MNIHTTTNQKEAFFTRTYANIMLADLFNRVCMYMMLTLLPLYMIERGLYTVAGCTNVSFNPDGIREE